MSIATCAGVYVKGCCDAEAALPHLDTKTGLTWTDDTMLNTGGVGGAAGCSRVSVLQEAPGVLAEGEHVGEVAGQPQ